MSTGQTQHVLTLRVMRLARPKFFEGPSMGVDCADDFSGFVNDAVKLSSGKDSMEAPVGGYLMAPQSIDDIYLGETFTFYIAVLNEGDQPCTDVRIQADIQTQTQKVALQSKLQEANATLEPKRFVGQVISHEIKEPGQHILVCTVQYQLDGKDVSFRKFFKFPVEKPIDVRTKFFNTEDNLNNDVYLEAQIQNLCTKPLVVDKVALEPSDLYSRRELGHSQRLTANLTQHNVSREANVCLNPQEVYQYLFCLTPNTADHSLAEFRGVTSIGKLDMAWRTTMGEPGRLQTSSLTRVLPSYGDIRLMVETIPGRIRRLELFKVTCRIMNCCERSLDLVLTLDNNSDRPFVFASLSGQRLGQVLPNSGTDFSLDVVPLKQGLHNLSGIRVTDTFLKRTYELDDIAQLLVTEGDN